MSKSTQYHKRQGSNLQYMEPKLCASTVASPLPHHSGHLPHSYSLVTFRKKLVHLGKTQMFAWWESWIFLWLIIQPNLIHLRILLFSVCNKHKRKENSNLNSNSNLLLTAKKRKKTWNYKIKGRGCSTLFRN